MDTLILSVKKLLKPIVGEMLDVYEQRFSSRSRKVKKFDRIVRTNRIYFTTEINTQGFSDQIARLIFFYKIGSRLGFLYHYNPLVSRRSAPNEEPKNSNSYSDIYDFLGINSYLEEISGSIPKRSFKRIVVNLDEMNFERRAGTSFRNFIFYLKLKIADQIRSGENVLICFRGSPSVFHFFRLAASVKSNLSLRECYFKNREKKPWKSVFEKDKINLLVHIRQGDTAIIETPWKSFIGLSYKIQNRFVQLSGKDEVNDYEVIDVKIYHKFLKELFRQLAIKQFSTNVFFDGFKKAFLEIYLNKMIPELEPSQVEELKKLERVYNQMQFRDFEEWEDVKTFIGETKENLFNLVHAFFESDIIIFGTQAKFIPKLASIYTDDKTMPLLIYLYQKNHPHMDYLGIDHSSDRVLFVNIHNYDIREISNRIMDYLLDRDEVNEIRI